MATERDNLISELAAKLFPPDITRFPVNDVIEEVDRNDAMREAAEEFGRELAERLAAKLRECADRCAGKEQQTILQDAIALERWCGLAGKGATPDVSGRGDCAPLEPKSKRGWMGARSQFDTED